MDSGRCRAIGPSDISLSRTACRSTNCMDRSRPVVQVEKPIAYLPETAAIGVCKEKEVVLSAFAPWGHGMRPGPLEASSRYGDCGTRGKVPGTGAVGLGGAACTAFADHGAESRRAPRKNFNIFAIPEDAVDEIRPHSDQAEAE